MIVQLSLIQRFGVETILISQKGNARDLHIIADVLEKLQITESLRKSFIKEYNACPTCRQPSRVDFDLESAELYPAIDVDLERAEIGKLEDILSKYDGFGPRDLKWCQPLIKQLKEDYENYTKKEKA